MLVTGGAAVLAGTVLVFWGSGDTPVRPLAGHGRGMSQPGAFDSAQQGWLAERILEHYYPGATLGAIPPANLAVRLAEQDGFTLDAYAEAGFRVAGRELEPGQVAHLTPLPDGGANIVVTVGCDGEVLWQTVTSDPWIYPLDPNPNRPAAEHLTLCGGTAYRGALGVALENGEPRTINRVGVEDYLLGVVPAEVQANWVDRGAGEALRAQAIAARSYVLAERRYPYAQTCDTTDCQAYPGTAKEDPRTAAAIASTAGTVLLRDGHILRSEYSAAPDGGEPADIYAFEVGPTPADLAVGRPPTDPRPDPRARAATAPSPIELEYRRLGGEASSLGAPIGPEMLLPQRAGTYRLFTNGVIIATPTLGAQVVDFTTLMQLVPDPGISEAAPTGPAQPGETVAPATTSTPGAAAPSGGVVLPGAEAAAGGNAQAGAATPSGAAAGGVAVVPAQPGGSVQSGATVAPATTSTPGAAVPSGGVVLPGAQAPAGGNAQSGAATPSGAAAGTGGVAVVPAHPGGSAQAVPGAAMSSGAAAGTGGAAVVPAQPGGSAQAVPGAATPSGAAVGTGGAAVVPAQPGGNVQSGAQTGTASPSGAAVGTGGAAVVPAQPGGNVQSGAQTGTASPSGAAAGTGGAAVVPAQPGRNVESGAQAVPGVASPSGAAAGSGGAASVPAQAGAASPSGAAAGTGGAAVVPAQPRGPDGQVPNPGFAVPTLEEVFGNR
ncbi:SpoIID/LytB domain-containing protein [Nocardia lijiangensis]|uniref:SpoIID/LytB domain-containing protein n=1 Tax=Nocardia lijiangensis TaxID=299618 RepID=UPI003D72AE5A